jgi:hypothetical protein
MVVRWRWQLGLRATRVTHERGMRERKLTCGDLKKRIGHNITKVLYFFEKMWPLAGNYIIRRIRVCALGVRLQQKSA